MATKHIEIDDLSANAVDLSVTTVKPELQLFGMLKNSGNVTSIEKTSVDTKYILAVVLDNTVFTKGIEEVDAMLLKMDWLTYPWQKIPFRIFHNLFQVMSMERLTFFCAWHKAYWGIINDDQRCVMIKALWNYYNGPEYAMSISSPSSQ